VEPKGRKFLIILLVALIAIGLVDLLMPKVVNVSSLGQSKLDYVINMINNQYVDQVNIDSLQDKAIRNFLEDLDPHSVYMTKEEIAKENENLQGNFDGIGVQFRIIEDTIVVVQPIVGGPSAKAGIMAGDRIVKVNDSIVCGKNITNEDVFKLLKGKRGTKVKLAIKRSDSEKLLHFTIKRDEIPIHSVEYSGMINAKIGYIKLSQFSANSHKEVYQALIDLKEKGMQELIFDLRGNGGGYLDAAINIADEFLPDGDLIVYTKGRAKGRQDYFASSKGIFEKGKIIVLIDEISASASEIVAGALQDNDRATIIGRRSFGKGLVQEQKQLLDGSVVRLTVSRYYTPSGRCIQRPYTNGDSEKYYMDFIERYAQMENNSDTISHADSLKYKTKKGRIVYGGGGIEPDKELSYNLYKRSESYSLLIRKGLIYKYCFDYLDKHRDEFTQFTSGDKFINEFSVSEKMYKEMLHFAQNQEVNTSTISEKEKKEIKLLMKSYFAQNIYGDEYFYKLYLQIDDDVQKVLKTKEL
jgi:carboxyl-terminal processing protease